MFRITVGSYSCTMIVSPRCFNARLLMHRMKKHRRMHRWMATACVARVLLQILAAGRVLLLACIVSLKTADPTTEPIEAVQSIPCRDRLCPPSPPPGPPTTAHRTRTILNQRSFDGTEPSWACLQLYVHEHLPINRRRG